MPRPTRLAASTRAAMLARGLTAGLLMVGAVLVGCSTVEKPKPLYDVDRVDEIRPAEPTIPFRVGFLTMQVGGIQAEATSVNARESKRAYMHPMTTDEAEDYTQELVDAFRTLRLFQGVEHIRTDGSAGMRVDGPMGDEEDAPAADSADPAADRQADRGISREVLADAWDDGFDVVVRPVLVDRRSVYGGQTGNYIPSLLLWFLTLPPFTWWIGDERFAGEMAIRLEFYSTATLGTDEIARRIYDDPPTIGEEEPVDGRIRVVRQLDDFGQGFNLFNIFITSSGMSNSAWEDVGNQLMPLADRRSMRWILQSAIDRDEENSMIEAFGEPAARAHIEKTLTLMIGSASRTMSDVPAYPEGDINQMVNALQTVIEGHPVTRDHWRRELRQVQATKSRVESTLRSHIVNRAQPGDRALIAFANQGIVTDPTGEDAYILLSDSRSDALGTTLSLRDLAATLRMVRGDVVILGNVSWQVADNPEAEITGNPWSALEGLPNVAIIAPSVHGRVLELDESGSSLFASLISEQMQVNAADIDANTGRGGNADGWLSWNEILGAVRRPFAQFSSLTGRPQEITTFGASTILSRPFFRISPLPTPTLPERTRSAADLSDDLGEPSNDMANEGDEVPSDAPQTNAENGSGEADASAG